MIKNKHYAFYGTTRMVRMYCKECNGMTLVVDNKKQCCDKSLSKDKGGIPEYMSSTFIKRRIPSKHRQAQILELQQNKCLYCDKPFGTIYVRKGKLLFTKIHFDHLVPYSYTQSCKDSEFVAACNICNNIKSNKMFETVEEVFHYVNYNRKKRDYLYPEDKGIA